MRYTVDWMENKTSAGGKAYKVVTLKTDRGSTFDKISLWPDHPNYADAAPGRDVFGEIRTNDKGYKSLSPEKASAPSRPPSGAVSAAKITQESVRVAQANKNASIAFFNATNSAISIYSEMMKDPMFVAEDPKKFITEWRDWFLSEWRNYEAGDITDKSRPF